MDETLYDTYVLPLNAKGFVNPNLLFLLRDFGSLFLFFIKGCAETARQSLLKQHAAFISPHLQYL